MDDLYPSIFRRQIVKTEILVDQTKVFKGFPFDQFQDTAVGMPNSMIRSGLFVVGRSKESRLNEVVATYGKFTIKVSGLTLNQYDKSVLKVILRISSCLVSKRVSFSSGQMIEELGLSRCKEVRDGIKKSLIKMATTIITIEDGESHFSDALLCRPAYDEELKLYSCELNEGVINLFWGKNSGWTLSLMEDNKKFIRCGLANFIYDFFMSHEHRFPLSITKLHVLSGSTRDKHHFNSDLKVAISKLEKELNWKIEIIKEKIFVDIGKSAFKTKLRKKL